jgi:hypothetical protein
MLSLLSWQSFVIDDGSESFGGIGTGPGENLSLHTNSSETKFNSYPG